MAFEFISLVAGSLIAAEVAVEPKLDLVPGGVRVSLENKRDRPIAIQRYGYYAKAYDSRGSMVSYGLPQPPNYVYYRHVVDADWIVLRKGQGAHWTLPIEWKTNRQAEVATVLVVINPRVRLQDVPPDFVKSARALVVKFPRIMKLDLKSDEMKLSPKSDELLSWLGINSYLTGVKISSSWRMANGVILDRQSDFVALRKGCQNCFG